MVVLLGLSAIDTLVLACRSQPFFWSPLRAAGTSALGIVRQPDSDAGLHDGDIAGPSTVCLLVTGAGCCGSGIRVMVMWENLSLVIGSGWSERVRPFSKLNPAVLWVWTEGPRLTSRVGARRGAMAGCAMVPLSHHAPQAIDMLAGTGVPAWFSTLLAMLQSSDNPLGERWTELVWLWVTFEQKEGFKQRGKLSPKKCLDIISEWIQWAHSPMWQPVITNVSMFEKSFHMWWLSLQPKWRLSKKGEILTQKMDGDLDGLRKLGLNGLLSVLAALFFWGRIAQNNTKQRKGWIGHVEDCILVLCGLVGWISLFYFTCICLNTPFFVGFLFLFGG